MKTRNGFVSNSSSSSFIVLFPHKPNNINDLKEMMFKDYSWDEEIKYKYYDNPLTVKQIVTRVYKDIVKGTKGPKVMSFDLNDILAGYITEVDSEGTIVHLLQERYNKVATKEYNLYNKLRDKYGLLNLWEEKTKWSKDKLYKKYLKIKAESEEAAKKWKEERNKEAQNWYNDFKDIYKYHKYEHHFEYGDRKGEIVLEHATVFRNLPHLVISNH